MFAANIECLSLYDSHMICFLFSILIKLASGGSVVLQGGQGQHSSPHDGSDGGSVLVMGGDSLGLGWHDHGGSIEVTAGTARRGTGGNVLVSSGTSSQASSKSLRVCILLWSYIDI